MKKIFFILFSCLTLLGQAQVCIRFDAPKNQLPAISRAVSIDRVDGTSITAYANNEELTALSSLGFNYQIISTPQPKNISMASSIEQMKQWNSYPTYETYVAIMQQFATSFPTLCHLDTIGHSVNNRLILCAEIHNRTTNDTSAPQFFYSSTMHGDEVTGFYLMLRLIDTLLNGYADNESIRQLVDQVDIFINPLSNPDGTYYHGDNTIQGATRYNANNVDLNRNYPDPFGTNPINTIQIENTAMMNYVEQHHFTLSANLHGGSEVMNYPWDSFTSYERSHPLSDSLIAMCKRFVDTSRMYDNSIFSDVTNSGYIPGGDWYVISNGRQDYMNYYHNCLEITMELSTAKTLSSDQLNRYWNIEHKSLINYIKELQRNSFSPVAITPTTIPSVRVYPNPTTGIVFLDSHTSENLTTPLFVTDMLGKQVLTFNADSKRIDLGTLPAGIYLLHTGNGNVKIIKQ